MPELLEVDPRTAAIVDTSGENLEAERRLRVILMPDPYLHSADRVPDKMRYVVGAEPPVSAAEAARIEAGVQRHADLKDVLSVNPDEPMAHMGIGFTADHLGMQEKHLERGALLAGIATEVVGVKIARVIFTKLVPNEELILFRPDEFRDDSDYHLEPRHYAYLA